MKRLHRLSAPKVIRGKVQRQNRIARSPDCFNTPRDTPAIHRAKPGVGYRHVLRQSEVGRFLALLPDWDELSRGLNVVLLGRGNRQADGWYHPGVVALCAWERELWRELSGPWYEQHRALFERLGVPCFPTSDGCYLCRFTEATVRAYQLLHVLLHELGHHHDRMTTRAQKDTCRGENYAEQYAWMYEALIWDRYLQTFELF